MLREHQHSYAAKRKALDSAINFWHPLSLSLFLLYITMIINMRDEVILTSDNIKLGVKHTKL